MNLTSTTSARITKSEASTTELGGRAAHARRAPARAHSLKACDKPDDQAKDRRLECGRQKVAERAPLKPL